jgi:hypothetical protein
MQSADRPPPWGWADERTWNSPNVLQRINIGTYAPGGAIQQAWADGDFNDRWTDQAGVIPVGAGDTPWEEVSDDDWDVVAPVRRTAVALQEWGSGMDPLSLDAPSLAELEAMSEWNPDKPKVRHAPVGTAELAEAERKRVARIKANAKNRRRAIAAAQVVPDEPADEQADELPASPPVEPWGAPGRPNRYPADCPVCGTTVQPGFGRLEHGPRNSWVAYHRDAGLCLRLAGMLAQYKQDHP